MPKLRVTTWNVNGLRAAIRKGFAAHLDAIAPDVLLLQEVRALPEQLPEGWAQPDGWHVVWHPAKKLGYAGTAVWSRHPITSIERGFGGTDKDEQGRVLTVQTAGITVTSVYLPKGDVDGSAKQLAKESWMRRFRRWSAASLERDAPPHVLGGDLNIAHTERDLYYAKSNANATGFLPQERAWIGRLLKAGWCDAVRHHCGDIAGPYTWWSNMGNARQLDRGWRIDYALLNPPLAPRLHDAEVHREAGLACSDHAPVTTVLGPDG